MTRINRIKTKLDVLKPHYCEIADESHMHSNHSAGGEETHFAIKIFADVFIGKTLVNQHKIIHQLLAEELSSGLHALSIKIQKSN